MTQGMPLYLLVVQASNINIFISIVTLHTLSPFNHAG